MIQDKGLANLQSCPGWDERDESLHSHIDQSFDVGCLRKGPDVRPEASSIPTPNRGNKSFFLKGDPSCAFQHYHREEYFQDRGRLNFGNRNININRYSLVICLHCLTAITY